MIHSIEKYSSSLGSGSGYRGYNYSSSHHYCRSIYENYKSKSNDTQVLILISKSSVSGISQQDKRRILNEVFNHV